MSEAQRITALAECVADDRFNGGAQNPKKMAAMMKKGDPPVAKKNRFRTRQRLASSPHNPNTTGISNFYYLCMSSHSWDGLCFLQ